MSDRSGYVESALKIAVLAGLLASSGAALAEDEEVPDMEFLEYLGSWDESDEDWVLLANNEDEPVATEEDESKPVPQGDKVAELDDEN